MSEDPVEQLFWELPRERQRKLLRNGLIEVLDLVTRGEVDADDLSPGAIPTTQSSSRTGPLREGPVF